MTGNNENGIYQKQNEDIKRLFHHGLESLAPERVIRSGVVYEEDTLTIEERSYSLSMNRRIWVFGSGKAAGRMAMELERILGNRIYDGIVICPYGLTTRTRRIQQFEASHPIPDLNSLTATYEMMDVALDVQDNDLVLYLMSGGSSSLLCMPHDALEFEDVREFYRQLLTCGAPIRDVNRMRKCISRVKGGQLRPLFGQAVVEMLAISDVPGNDAAVIGSGPLVHDPVSPDEGLELLHKYQIEKNVPQAVIRFLDNERMRSETAEHNQQNGADPDMKTRIAIVASAEKVAEAIEKGALSLGYHVYVHDGYLTGEARKIAKSIAGQAVDVLAHDQPVPKPAALIYYGESTVTVKGSGKGGRNQEMVLSAAMALEGQHHITFLSGGTDGRDGETNAAGAICNAQTGLDARKAGIEPEPYLENNDSWNFFRKTDGLLVTGVTGNNLMDIQIVLIEK